MSTGTDLFVSFTVRLVDHGSWLIAYNKRKEKKQTEQQRCPIIIIIKRFGTTVHNWFVLDKMVIDMNRMQRKKPREKQILILTKA